MEKLRGSADEYTTDELCELADREAARHEKFFAELEEDRKRQEAWWLEHEQWCKDHGVPVPEWRYPGDLESEP